MLMPVLLVLIVSTIWVMGWVKQMDAQAIQASKPSVRAIYLVQSDSPDDYQQP